MIPPCVASVGLDADRTFGSNWGHGGCIEREHAVHRFMCREVGVLGVKAHHVEGDVGLFEVFALVRRLIGFWCASSDGNKVIFPYVDCLLCWVSLVDIR